MDEKSSTNPVPVGGSGASAEELLPAVYNTLRQLAHQKMRREPPGQLQTTALVHEAFLRLKKTEVKWNSPGHFYGAAAEAMRRILIEDARERKRLKHGGGLIRVPFEFVDPPNDENPAVLLLDEALTRLEQKDARKAQIVKLRYFAGLTIEETANALEISAATVKADWSYARAWLQKEIADATN